MSPALAVSLSNLATWPAHPAIYEINTWVWLGEVAQRAGADPATFTLHDVPAREWDAVVPDGIDAVWLMGVWERSAAGRAIAFEDEGLRESWSAALPGWTDPDIAGSPYSIRTYDVAAHLGGRNGLIAARAELAARGARLVVDFVPNHLGPDTPWLLEDPSLFVTASEDDLGGDPDSFVRLEGPSGSLVVARGRDPYFPAWPDVIQLNPFSPHLRQRVIDTVRDMATLADGVRCDMAMLFLDDIAHNTWGARIGDPLATPYWVEVINAVHESHPGFRFMAEVYWDREPDLIGQGFAACYDKRLYDRLADEDAASVRAHLVANPDWQQHTVRFLENHDEPRAAATFAPTEREKACAVAVATLPGTALWYEGQFEGRTVKLPVFLGRRPVEAADTQLRAWYERLLEISLQTRRGTWQQLDVHGWSDDTSSEHLLAWSWDDPATEHRIVVAINDSANAAHGLVQLPWSDFDDQQWISTDLLDGATYSAAGSDLMTSGLYVARDAWQAHVLRLDPA
jgi:glycosidase